MNRVDRVRSKMEDLDALILLRGPNISYITQVPNAGGCLILTREGENILLVSSLEFHRIRDHIKLGDVNIIKVPVGERILDLLPKYLEEKWKVGVDSTNVKLYEKIKGSVKEIDGGNRIVEDLRRVKDPEEVRRITEAVRIAEEGMKSVMEALRAGLRETEVAGIAEKTMRDEGSEGTPFPTIVASGFRSVYPHAGSTRKKIREGEAVIIDLGATYEGYCSDMTRTLYVGREPGSLYDAVREAKEKAARRAKQEEMCSEVDRVARRILEEYKLGEYFIHNLGHGVGLEIHESPSLSPTSKDKLEAGNVITIEPGVYIYRSEGVRIEDMYIVTEEGVRRINRLPYS